MGYVWYANILHKSCLGMQSSPSGAYPLIHLPHSTLLPTPSSQQRLCGVIFMHHQDEGADECQQYTHGHPRPSTRASLLQKITIMCCSTRFHSALTRWTYLGLVSMWVLKRRFIAGFYTILFMSRALYYNFNVPYLLHFTSTGLQERIKLAKFMAVFGTASNHNLLYSNL